MIKSVRLENWKTHKDSFFEFSRGTNVLIGPMGAGTTSCMDGICFALYGTFPALTAHALKLEEVITSKPHPQDFARVRLEFDYRDEEYMVERTIYRKGTNEGKLYRQGKLIAGPKTTEATARLEEILEMNYDLFARAVYSEQNQLDYFLKLSSAQRKEKFDELLEISKYENVRGNAVSLGNRLKKLSEDRKQFLQQQQKGLDEGALREARASLAQKEKLAEAARARLEAERHELTRLEKEAEALAAQEKAYRMLREQALKARARAGEAERATQALEKEADGISLAQATEKLRTLEQEAQQAREQAQELEKKADQAEEERTGLLQLAAGHEREAERLRKASEQLKELKAHCPVCKTKLEEHAKHSLLKETEQEKGEMEKRAKAMKEAAAKSTAEKEKLRREARACQLKLDECAKHKNEIERALEATQRLAKAKAEAGLRGDEAAKAEQELAAGPCDEEAWRRAREKTAQAREKIHSTEKEIGNVKELAAEIERRVKEFEERKKQLQELAQTIQAQEKMAEKVGVFTHALKATQAELRESLINTVNQAMADIWEKVYPYGDYTSCRIQIEEGNYEVMVQERLGKWVRVEGVLSGGERSAVAITLRVAVSLVLAQNLSWLILDEPTHNLDARTVEGLSQMMREHLPGLVEQVFIITHDKEMERASSASLYVLERDKENDGITKPVRAEPAEPAEATHKE